VDLAGLLELDEIFKAIDGVDGKIKKVEPDNVHLTLKFMGDTRIAMVHDIVDIMRDAVKDASPFSLSFKGVGAFPKRDYVKVLWVGVEGAEGIETVKGISRHIDKVLSHLGFKRDKRGFSPHLTVARVKFVRDKRALRHVFDAFEGVEFGKVDVASIKLKKSVLSPKGPTYSTVEEVEIKQ
jgi:2'-5' RNA ligase